jgi:uncharacterized membrane protein
MERRSTESPNISSDIPKVPKSGVMMFFISVIMAFVVGVIALFIVNVALIISGWFKNPQPATTIADGFSTNLLGIILNYSIAIIAGVITFRWLRKR